MQTDETRRLVTDMVSALESLMAKGRAGMGAFFSAITAEPFPEERAVWERAKAWLEANRNDDEGKPTA